MQMPVAIRTAAACLLVGAMFGGTGAVPTTTLASVSASKMMLEWVKYTFHAGHVCSLNAAHGADHESMLCRSYAHTVMFVAPEDVTAPVIGGATYRLVYADKSRNTPPMAGGPATFERHLVQSNGNATIQKLPKGKQAQMWNWGFDQLENGVKSASLAETLPQQICIVAWFTDLSNDATHALDEACIEFVLNKTAARPMYPPAVSEPMRSYFQPDRSASHAVCGSKSCRTNVHVVFKMQTGGGPLDSMTGGAEISFDDGPYTPGGFTFYEQHIDSVDGKLYQAMQADLDILTPLSDGAADKLPKKACFKIWVQDAITSKRAPLNTSGVPLPPGWINGSCLNVCRTLHAFHTPYCPEAL